MNEVTPLKLFRQGYDTVEIAVYLGCTEATAANLLHREKEAERANDRALIRCFDENKKPAQTAATCRSLIRYAGYEEERI